MPAPLPAAQKLPKLEWPAIGAARVSTVASRRWKLLVVYRGAHCGMCKRYLIELNGLRASFDEESVGVAAVSADTRAKAQRWVDELALAFPLAYGLGEADMHALGLYVSKPAPRDGVRHVFAEPAVFLLDPRGRLHMACVGNAPYARPPLGAVLDGVKEIRKQRLAPHGTIWPVVE